MSGSPFKFLDFYTREDKDIFFGRDREIEEIYQKVFESKILVVSGLSGTGKSSIIHCGLANKFEDSDWLPIIIRRSGNINTTLRQKISKFTLTKEKSRDSILPDQLKSLYLDHFKPLYLIFDQFEELFIFGTKPERKEFIDGVKEIISSDIQCKLIFIVRDEYLAWLIEFEKEIPAFLSNRIRIEKMTWVNAKHAIEEPCKVHEIEVEKGLAENILGKLSPEGTEVELTYLQVLLDKLFRLSMGKNDKKPEFSNELLQKIGDVSDLLGSFLEDQITQMDDPGTGLAILKSFVSMKGTKRQVTLEDVSEFAKTMGKEISLEELKNLVTDFVSLRILRGKDENGRYELRHDSLATKIYEKITLVEKELLEVRQFIENAYSNFEKRNVYLSIEDLKYIAPYKDKLFLNSKIEKFIEDSEREKQKAKRRIRNIAISAGIALLIVLSGFSIWALNERTKSKQQTAIAELERNKAQANNFNFIAKELVNENPTLAFGIAEYALSLDTTNQLIKNNLRRIYYDNNFYKIVGIHKGGVNSVAFSPDGKTILTGSKDNTARLWDIEGNELQIFKGHEDRISSVAFSPDGKTLLTGSRDNTARLWDIEGNELQVFKGHEDYIYSAVFSPDGKTILTGSYDNTARLWDLEGNELQVLKGHEDAIFSVAFSPDGNTILTGSGDNTARLWDIKPSLEEFQKNDEYEKLNIRQKIEYGIFYYQDADKLIVEDELFEAANYYSEVSSNFTKEERIDYLNIALNLYNKLLSKHKKAKYFIELHELYLNLQELNPTDKYIDETDIIVNELLKLTGEEDLLNGADFFYRKGIDSDRSIKIYYYSNAIILFEKIIVDYPETNVTDDASSCYNNLSLEQLFNKQYPEALINAKKGLALKDDEIRYTKLALANLLNNKYDEAISIILDHKDAQVNNDLFSVYILNKLVEFEEAGITHPDFEKVRELLEQ